jgi:dTDP-4-dehydrorhamnose 3,5-epimerase
MEVVKTSVAGALLVKPKIWGDARGRFVETWQQKRYADAGMDLPFVQDNHSRSTYGVLRGLHFQKTRTQGKLVSVSLGSVFDVIVDIREGSPTYGQWYGVELTGDNAWQLWAPPGLAHGFVVTSDIAHFHYKVTDFYHPEDEGCIRWNDPVIGVRWPVEHPQLSGKDAAAPLWREMVISG